MQILNYQNDVTNLDEQLTKQLYSDEIVASVSRLELFNQCEFAHYLRYGLKLKEKEETLEFIEMVLTGECTTERLMDILFCESDSSYDIGISEFKNKLN